MTPSKLHTLGATEAMALLQRREIRSEDLVRASLERINARDGDVHAFVHVAAVAALAQARALDAGPVRGLLHGLPVGVKDLIDTSDLPTGYGSSIYAAHRPAADAACVALCRDAGAVVLGKTVTTEFACFTPGPTANPRHLLHTPGGSSSGSAAAVSDQMLPLALGTQTAGSIIRPAAYCGVVGYKPGLSRAPQAGIKSLSPTLDVVGGFGRSVDDAALLGAVLCSDERLHQTRVDGPLRVGLFPSPQWAQADDDVQRCWEIAVAALARHGIACQDIDAPDGHADLIELQKTVMTYEMARALSHERLRHREALSPQLRDLLDSGVAISAQAHERALQRLHELKTGCAEWMGGFDVLLTPSTTGAAPLGLVSTGDPVFCRSWSALGLPCVHLPLSRNRLGLPVGLQLVGAMHQDHRLLAAAHHLHPLMQH